VEFTDTHCHLDFNKFDKDRSEVLQRAIAASLTRILIPGISIQSSRDAVMLAERHQMVFSAIGVQPNNALPWDDRSIDVLKELYVSASKSSPDGRNKIVAVGEIGLDYYWEAAPREQQRSILRDQMMLAADLGLPVILHMREKKDAEFGDCASDLLEIITDWTRDLKATANRLARHPGVIHSFSGNHVTAEKAIEIGFLIGVTGPVTYSNNRKRQELIAGIPLERILLETDAPFLSPHPKRGQRNEPANIPLVAAKIAELQGKTLAEVADLTSANAKNLFSW
jgi:TatD DNase family protein